MRAASSWNMSSLDVPIPWESMRTAVGQVEGARELFAQLAAELPGAGQFEGANRAYVIAQWAGTNLLDPSDYLFLMTGDGRYPLWIYGLAFVALYCFAYATFARSLQYGASIAKRFTTTRRFSRARRDNAEHPRSLQQGRSAFGAMIRAPRGYTARSTFSESCSWASRSWR